ncbi:septal ring lytic transglycosylase RlpA family protein [Ideonella sp.]|uniref:septal ring lytic transglycosylase RlpA family protein n=1 Tax=Ideonella sp. TaxID=1929293 RepID=UPI002B477C75|nr:septal ring lytic transglycosylase RlpA family protein [Ideonella sp.]HJV69462.1 septal ring lytic transglycosylase RlpA family protein [Ideonella sp.]
MIAAVMLAGCSTTPGMRGADGPPPAGSDTTDLKQTPDAEPRVEPIRPGGPNKPYEVLGKSYVPMTGDEPLVERGLASWYGRKFHGRRTASGETYNMYAMTAAHKTMPIPSYARVRNPANGREIIVRVNDRGPFSSGRVIDLSYAAAVKLGVQNGVAQVEVERITYEDIRAGLAGRGPVLARAPEPEPAPALPAATGVSTVVAPAADPAPADAPAPSRAHTPAASGFWLQLGAFGQGGGAYSFQQRLAQEMDWLSPLLTVFSENGLFRLQAGPYASRDQAREAAERVRSAVALVPVIVERR